jgi:hypothetical protein
MITVDLTNKDITLTEVGALSADGVTMQALYSKLKEIWKDEATAIPFEFPIEALTEEKYEWRQNWVPANDATRKLIRTAGWAEKNTSGVTKREYAGIISLGSIGGTDQGYYVNGSGSATNFTYDGPVNEAVQIYGDASNGNFDYRSSLTLYVREQAKTYASSSLADIGVTTMSYQAYRFPLANAADTKVTQSDVTVDAYGVTITWYGTNQSRTIGASSYNFRVIIDGNNRTAEQIYMAVQSALRKATDIDAGAGTKTGKITNELLRFVGDTLYTKLDSTGGVFIDNYQSADINRLVFVDNTNTERTFPYTATLTINFGDNLKNDASAKYWVFFTTNPAGNMDTANAVLVDDASNADMAGNVSGASSIQKTFSYDSNTQGGRTAGTDADITAVGIGLATGQYVRATSTIGRSTGNSISLIAPLERVYNNP